MTAGIGMACAGAAGALISPMFDTQPFLATDFTLIAFIIVIVGGLGSLTGALFGGILIGLAEAIAALAFSPSLKTPFSYALLVFVLLLRPNGLFGERERSSKTLGRRLAGARLLRGHGRCRPLLDSFWQSLLTLVFFYAFMGMTWNLMMTAGLLSLGHALFLGLGAYATAVFTANGWLSPWLAILVARSFRRRPGGRSHGSASGSRSTACILRLLTIAFAEFTRVVFDNWGLVGGTGGYFLKAINPEPTIRSNAAGRHPLFLSCLPCHHCGRVFRDRRILMNSRWGYRWRGIARR